MHFYKILGFALTILSVPCIATGDDNNQKHDLLTLRGAIDRAIEKDPELKRLELEAVARDHEIHQASKRPNPTVGTEIENIVGSGPFSSAQKLEITLGIRQTIETKDKRSKRTELARNKHREISWEIELRKRDLEAGVRSTFETALLAREEVELYEEMVSIAEKSAQETDRMTKGARATDADLARAQLSVQRAKFALNRANRSLVQAKINLSSWWSENPTSDYAISGDWDIPESVPELLEIIGKLDHTPALEQFETKNAINQSAVNLEKARATPNIELFAGARYSNEADGHGTLLAGAEIPWTLFDKNEGNIAAAKARMKALKFSKEAQRRKLIRELASLHKEMLSAKEEAEIIEKTLLTSAQTTLDQMERGYEENRYTLLSLLESQEVLLDTRLEHLRAKARFAEAWNQIQAYLYPSYEKSQPNNQ